MLWPQGCPIGVENKAFYRCGTGVVLASLWRFVCNGKVKTYGFERMATLPGLENGFGVFLLSAKTP
jgi:hypothetical protein